MTEEEIIKINLKLKKMIDKSEINESVARDLLVRFETLYINLMILQNTGIGKTVNELRRITTSEELSITAKNLLKKWKKLVPEPSVSTPSIKNDKSIASTHHYYRQSQEKESINQTQRHETNKIANETLLK